jgi:dTDP-4-amino-4,6-dideoxygalactose transaminase
MQVSSQPIRATDKALKQNRPLFVTRPALPPLEKFLPYLEQIWDSRTLTNCGPFHQQLEAALAKKFQSGPVSLVANATIGLILAIRALRLSGEVITTPFSFVATSHALLWSGVKPVFVDIEASSMNIDPDRIEAAITEQTSAILAVHCYGRPCDVDRIEKIADRHGLKVIYDAAHAFGSTCHCGSVLTHGDLSVLSFHATKTFNTFEGGAIVCKDHETKRLIDDFKNFGFEDETSVVEVGINGKLSEFNSALGLLQLDYLEERFEARKKLVKKYIEKLSGIPGVSIPDQTASQETNYSYFPILVLENYPISRDELYQKLRSCEIYTRRYFYPLISTMPMYRVLPSASAKNLPVANRLADQVLCLPLYADLAEADLLRVAKVIQNPHGH